MLPAVTLETAPSPTRISFRIGDEVKSRSNTISTLEALNENDGEDDVTSGGAAKQVRVNGATNGTGAANTSLCEVEIHSTCTAVVRAQWSSESGTGTASDLLSDSMLSDHDGDGDLITTQATSAPSDYPGEKRTYKHIHPRTTSDPRGMSAERLDGQAVTHFRDADLCAHKRISTRASAGKSVKIAESAHPSGSSSGFAEDSSPSATSLATRTRRTEVAFAVSDVRETSCESYRTARDRSRSDSVRTDTSGVSCSEHLIDAIAEEGGSSGHLETSLHPSSHLRRSLNLRRVPNYQRRFSNPVLTPILKTLQQDCDVVSEYTLSFTSSRDVHGYATLRDLKRHKRADSNGSEVESPPARPLSETFGSSTKSNSRDLKLFTRLRYAVSSVKLKTCHYCFVLCQMLRDYCCVIHRKKQFRCCSVNCRACEVCDSCYSRFKN